MPNPFASWQELASKSEAELIHLFDGQLHSTSTPGIAFIRDEIAHRRAAAQFDEMRHLTKIMNHLTWWIFGLTVINTFAAITSVAVAICSHRP